MRTAAEPASRSKDAAVKKTKNKDADAAAGIHATVQAYGVLIAPIVTEKSHRLGERGQYVFRVATTTTAHAVKAAVEQVYGVTVTDVRTMMVKPKRRTMKYRRGYQKACKKAVVTLATGQTIDVLQSA